MLLQASQTRWLSLESRVNRLLEQYDALISYFRSTDEASQYIVLQKILKDLLPKLT